MIYSQIWFSSQVQFTDWLTEWFSWKIQFIFEYFHNKLIEHASRTNLWYCMMYFWYFCVVFFKSWNIILLFIVIELKWVTSPILYFIRIFSFCVPRRKVMTGWNNIRVNKWWQDFHSCVKFSFKPKSVAERKKRGQASVTVSILMVKWSLVLTWGPFSWEWKFSKQLITALLALNHPADRKPNHCLWLHLCDWEVPHTMLFFKHKTVISILTEISATWVIQQNGCHLCHSTLLFKYSESVRFFFKEIYLLKFSKDALNRSKLTVKTLFLCQINVVLLISDLMKKLYQSLHESFKQNNCF